MSTRLFGVLVDGLNKPIINATVTLLARQNTITILNGSEAIFRTDATGFYNITVQSGHYNVIVGPQGIEPYKAGEIAIYADSEEGSLNGYLVNWVPEELTPEIIKEVQDLVARSEQFALDAGRSASSATADATDARGSKAASQSAASEALTYKNDAKSSADEAKLAQQGASGSANTATQAVTTVQNLKSDVEQLKSDTQTIKDSALTEINTSKNSGINEIDTAKLGAVETINTAKTNAIADITPLKQSAEAAATLAGQKATTATEQATAAAGSATTAGEKAANATSAASSAETAAATAEQVTQASLKKAQNLADLVDKNVARTTLRIQGVECKTTTNPGDYNTFSSPNGLYSLRISNAGKWMVVVNADNSTSPLSIASGGTGATNAAGARANLGLAAFLTDGSEARMFNPTNPRQYIFCNASATLWGAYDLDAQKLIPLTIDAGGTGASNAAGSRANLELGESNTPSFAEVAASLYNGANSGPLYMRNHDASRNLISYSSIYNELQSSVAKTTIRTTNSTANKTAFYQFDENGEFSTKKIKVGAGYSFIMEGGEYNKLQLYTADKAPINDWANFTSYIWYNDYSISGAVRGGSDKIKCHRLRVYSPGNDATDFDFVPQGEIYANRGATVYVYSKNPTSDRDLKSEITYTEGRESYDRVMQWLPTMFKYKGSDIQRYGLIAQDLAKIDLQYVKIVPGAPIFEDVMGINEEGEEYVDHQIETGVDDDILSLDSNVMLVDMACAMVYMGNELEQQRKELDELKLIIKTLLQTPNPDIP